MPDFFGRITLEGVADLITDLNRYDKRIQTEVAHEIEASTRTMVRNAKRLAPKDQGLLVQNISNRKVDALNQEYISGAEYSAFREFGTKSKFRLSNPELSQIAQSFKGAKLSKGRLGFRQTIFEWAKRVGIPKEAWYPIFLSIIRLGAKAQPFFFPPYFAEIPLLRKRLLNILNKTA